MQALEDVHSRGDLDASHGERHHYPATNRHEVAARVPEAEACGAYGARGPAQLADEGGPCDTAVGGARIYDRLERCLRA